MNATGGRQRDMVSVYWEQLAVSEARFRAEVVSGLQREAQRLRDHRVIAGDQPAAAESLEQLAAALMKAAYALQAQDGRLSRALQRDREGLLSSALN